VPAVDSCEEQVIRAMLKEGWRVTHRPISIPVLLTDNDKQEYLFADVRFRQQQSSEAILIVEIKCFSNPTTILSEFYRVVGQYLVYRNGLALIGVQEPIYLAVPASVYHRFFQMPIIDRTLQDTNIATVIVDLEQEEIVTWNH
jgi:hypothetical protein